MQKQRITGLCQGVLLALALFSNSLPAYAQDSAPPASETQASEAVGVAATAAATELLVYEVNRPVTREERGFPQDTPPRAAANGNWYTPVNFAEGTLYFRVYIRHQPTPQNMKINFCAWQYNYTLENCSAAKSVSGVSGTLLTWSQTVQSLWKKDGRIIDWRNPRQRYGLAIKNSQGRPVSPVRGWNWSGEDPNKWYPLDMRFTVVVVAKGAKFGGWAKYVGASAAGTTAVEEPVLEGETGSGLEPNDLIEGQMKSLYLPLVINP